MRPNLPGTFHHVMNRAIDRGAAFRNDSDRVEFGQRLGDIFERFGVVTHAYCLMTTHFHLLLECPNGALSEAMQRLGSMYTRHVNDRLGRDGAIFRGRFASRLIDNDEYLLMACRYIHRNVLDLPGVSDVTEYRWSSHRTYLGLRTTPVWMRTDEVLGHWNGDRAGFDEFVRHDVDDDRSRDRSGPPAGNGCGVRDRARRGRSSCCETGPPVGDRLGHEQPSRSCGGDGGVRDDPRCRSLGQPSRSSPPRSGTIDGTRRQPGSRSDIHSSAITPGV